MILTKAQEPRIEAKPVDLRTWHIFINGQRIDTFYGTPVDAVKAVEMWRESLADPMVLDWLDIPFEQLPPIYFKNGHIPPLDDEPIPFEGEPAQGDEDTARSRYGLGGEYR